jgi:hypothetical protein
MKKHWLGASYGAAMQARQYVGDQSASKTGKFSMWDCFDLNVGSIVCVTKEAAKLYTNSFQAGLVEQAKQKAYHSALQSALAQGMVRKEAERQSQKLARAAGKEKSHQAQRILGPLFAAVWDTFEVLYYGGSFVEASMRASGTLSGTWFGALEVLLSFFLFLFLSWLQTQFLHTCKKASVFYDHADRKKKNPLKKKKIPVHSPKLPKGNGSLELYCLVMKQASGIFFGLWLLLITTCRERRGWVEWAILWVATLGAGWEADSHSWSMTLAKQGN